MPASRIGVSLLHAGVAACSRTRMRTAAHRTFGIQSRLTVSKPEIPNVNKSGQGSSPADTAPPRRPAHPLSILARRAGPEERPVPALQRRPSPPLHRQQQEASDQRHSVPVGTHHSLPVAEQSSFRAQAAFRRGTSPAAVQSVCGLLVARNFAARHLRQS